LMTALKKDVDKGGRFWYRGHAMSTWSLLPSYHRLRSPPPESVLINRFRQNANLLVTHQPTSSFDWLFWMQHYGVPTRLLDWTESPLVALYFAVQSHPKKEAIVWALDPIKLNKATKAKPSDYNFVPSFDDKEKLAEYETISIEAKPQLGIEPMAVIATRNNTRIQAQLGCFTVSHYSKVELRAIGKGSHLVGYKIPAASKKMILKELDILAFGKFQLFPELATIGDAMRSSLR
ncbi:MAG: FRG domain-containing protein, partial [Pseudonocardiaceae bacterium]